MKKFAFLLVALFCLGACSTEESNLTITGKVQGLKKGTLYLQKIEDTTLVTLDSVQVKGDPSFAFKTNLEGPQILYLYLNKVDGSIYDDRVPFFAEPGEMMVNTTLQNFETDVVVEGSENQKKLAEYRQMMQRFNTRNLELIQSHLEARKESDTDKAAAAEQEYDQLLKRRYLFTVNFAINNKDMELAPYLAISEIHDANVKYLDTIYQSLTPKVKESMYGKSLQDFIAQRKEAENKNAAVD